MKRELRIYHNGEKLFVNVDIDRFVKKLQAVSKKGHKDMKLNVCIEAALQQEMQEQKFKNGVYTMEIAKG